MTVRLYEWDKTETGWAWIEITDNKVVNLLLRSLNNLIKINADNEAYVDLQLEDWIEDDANMPVWVNVGRVLQADWWLANWTLLDAKTTSGDEIRFLFADDWKLYTDNWTWTFKQIYLKPEVDALFTQLRWELATVSFSWEYNDLLHKPALWTAASRDVGTNPWNVPEIWLDWKLPSSILPAMAMHAFTVATKNDLTTLSNAVSGDIGFVEDENNSYILVRDPYSTLSNWQQYSAVNSVNWYRWVVSLTTDDIPENSNKLYVSPTEKATWNNKLWTNNVATVALTGNFNDLNNKPTVDTAMSSSSTNAVQNKVIKAYVDSTASWSASAVIDDTAYWSSWDWDTTHAPSKNAVYDEVHAIEWDISNIQWDISTIQWDITNLGNDKQDTLVSGTNIKTINNESLLWSGNIDLSSIIVSASTFGEFINACKSSGTRHEVGTSVEMSYTFQWLWFLSIDMFYNCVVSINWEIIMSADYASWERYGFWPITLWPWDIVTSVYKEAGRAWHTDGFIADYY